MSSQRAEVIPMLGSEQEMNNKVEYEIRCFEWSDIHRYFDEITAMQLENTYVFHYPQKKPSTSYVTAKLLELEKHLKMGNTYFIGATREDVLYGYIWCYETKFIDEKRMTISSIFVREDARRTGLGQLLMDEAKKIAIHTGCVSIGTHYASFNTAAGAFYGRNGFEPVRVEMVCRLD